MKISELPVEARVLALRRQTECQDNDFDSITDFLDNAFNWCVTKEGENYWNHWHNKEAITFKVKEEPKHYDNSKGSLYKFCEEHDVNTYEFDIIKRVMRCRKKGLFIEDLEKTKFLIDLYIKEMKEDEK